MVIGAGQGSINSNVKYMAVGVLSSASVNKQPSPPELPELGKFAFCVLHLRLAFLNVFPGTSYLTKVVRPGKGCQFS